MADRGEGELLGVVDHLGEVRQLLVHARHVDGDSREFHVGEHPADRQLKGGQQVLGFAFVQFRFEVPAQGLDDGGHVDQRAGSGGVVLAVERQLQLAGLGRLGGDRDVEVVLGQFGEFVAAAVRLDEVAGDRGVVHHAFQFQAAGGQGLAGQPCTRA